MLIVHSGDLFLTVPVCSTHFFCFRGTSGPCLSMAPRRRSEHLETMQRKAEASREGRKLSTSPSEDTESWHSIFAAATFQSFKVEDQTWKIYISNSKETDRADRCRQHETHCIQSDFSVFTNSALCQGQSAAVYREVQLVPKLQMKRMTVVGYCRPVPFYLYILLQYYVLYIIYNHPVL